MRPTDTTITLKSDPVHAAGGFRMMARHLLTGIEDSVDIAHPTRLTQVADEAEALLHDAFALVGEDQHDREIWRRIGVLRDKADLKARGGAIRVTQ